MGKGAFLRRALAVNENRIVEVDKSHEIEKTYTPRETIDAKGCAVMPGLINCHVHLPQMLLRGVQDDVDTMTKLTKYIWPLQGHYDEEDGRVSSLLGFLEMATINGARARVIKRDRVDQRGQES